jgi:hypothetical protein
MAPSKPAGRVTIDYRFIAAPHDLLLDAHVSPLAFRLWCMLLYIDWTKEPPSIPILQKYLQQADGTPPTRRSIYRWFSELESRGWLEWIRAPGKAGINDRVILKTHGKPVTPESQPGQPVIVESQPAILRSQVEIVGSQVDYFHALSEPPKNTTQNHEKIQNGVGGGRTLAFLIDQGVNAAEEFADLPYDAMRLDYDARRADHQSNGAIVRAWRRKPPTKDYHYEQQRSNGKPNAPDRRLPAENRAAPARIKRSTWKPESSD